MIHIFSYTFYTSNNKKTFSIVTEMYDIRNRQLANITCSDDFIVSPNLISKYILQLSENKNIKKEKYKRVKVKEIE